MVTRLSSALVCGHSRARLVVTRHGDTHGSKSCLTPVTLYPAMTTGAGWRDSRVPTKSEFVKIYETHGLVVSNRSKF